MTTIDQIRGTEFRRLLKATATGDAVAPDWATDMATFVFDAPDGSRLEYKWRPGGTSSAEVTLGPGSVPLIVIPTTTTVNWQLGQWNITVFVRNPATNQFRAIEAKMLVRDPSKSGPAPTVA